MAGDGRNAKFCSSPVPKDSGDGLFEISKDKTSCHVGRCGLCLLMPFSPQSSPRLWRVRCYVCRSRGQSVCQLFGKSLSMSGLDYVSLGTPLTGPVSRLLHPGRVGFLQQPYATTRGSVPLPKRNVDNLSATERNESTRCSDLPPLSEEFTYVFDFVTFVLTNR